MITRIYFEFPPLFVGPYSLWTGEDLSILLSAEQVGEGRHVVAPGASAQAWPTVTSPHISRATATHVTLLVARLLCQQLKHWKDTWCECGYVLLFLGSRVRTIMSSTQGSLEKLRVGDVELMHKEKELSVGWSRGRVQARGPAGRRPHSRAGLEGRTKQERVKYGWKGSKRATGRRTGHLVTWEALWVIVTVWALQWEKWGWHMHFYFPKKTLAG